MKKFILIFILFLIPFKGFADSNFEINAATLTPGYDIDLSLKNARELEIDTINLSVKIDIDSKKSGKAKFSDAEKKKLKSALEKISKEGYEILIEPFPWIKGGREVETNYSPENIKLFFTTWKSSIDEILDISEDYELDGVLIENNFISLYGYVNEWEEIIHSVKERTNARVGFKINWWYNAEWDPESYDYYNSLFNLSYLYDVDYINIPAYFELVDRSTDNVDQLIRAWRLSTRYDRKQPIYEQIKKLSEHYDKKIFFGELGYTKYSGTTVQPWNYSLSSKINEDEQSMGFKAFFEIFKNKEFVLGYSLFQIGREDSDYYFMDNKAEETIKSFLR